MEDLIILGVLVFIFAVIGIITAYAISKHKKEIAEIKERCTIHTTGTLKSVAQRHSSLSTDGYDNYYYYPTVAFMYEGEEVEAEGVIPHRKWRDVQPGISVDVFVNPEDIKDVYVPTPR